jgi:hypothetical protein
MQEILLLLYANNFLTLANYIALGLLLLFVLKSGGRLYILRDMAFASLVLASLSYMVLYLKNAGMPSASSFFLRFVAPILLYYFGFMVGKEGTEKLKRNVLFIGFGGFLHGFLNIITNRDTDFLTIEGRSYNDIYGGNLSGTLQSLLFVVMCSLLSFLVLERENKWLKILGIASACIALYGAVTNASRTLIYLTVIVFFVGMLIYQREKTNLLTGVAKTTAILMVAALIVGLIIWLDLFRVQEWFSESALGQRLSQQTDGSSVSQNARWTYASDILKLLPSYPLGGMNYPHYAHNLWVDIAKDAGIIPFAAYIVFALLSVKAGWRVLVDKKMKVLDKVFFVTVLLGLFMVFFTEPVMEGSPITFTIFCFIVGGVSSAMQSEQKIG